MGNYIVCNELYHHGVLGMKWGVRRYQSYAENPKLSDREKAKKAYKAAKIQAKYEKKVSRSEASDAKITAAREKNLNKIIDRYGKNSAHYLDFTKGSEYIKAGQTKYNDIIRDYGEMRAAAAKDPSIKNTPEYKAAKSAYRGQQLLKDFMYNGLADAVKLNYAADLAKKDTSVDWVKNNEKMKIEKERYKASKKANEHRPFDEKPNNTPYNWEKKPDYKKSKGNI